EGSAVWYVIGIDELIPHDFAFLKDFPVFVALLTQLTVIFEIYFVFAVWSRLRPVWLLIGFLFHLGTAVFMGLYFFCLVMIGPYLLFIESSTLKRAVERIAHGWRRLPLTLKLRG